MSDKEIFQSMRDIIDALEKEWNGDVDVEKSVEVNLQSDLYAALSQLANLLDRCKQLPKSASVSPLLTTEVVEDIASLASLFDLTGDELLMKEASALDEILLTIGASKRAVNDAKSAQDREIEKIKASAAKEEEDPYKFVKTEHDRQLKVDETRKVIEDKVKNYRPMEAPLMTRTCPDHPGAQMSRIADSTYQCSLDKNVYNYQSGFTTMKGDKVPGTSVLNQSKDYDNPNEFTSFETRESRLNK